METDKEERNKKRKVDVMKKRNIKGILLSLSKPSYTLNQKGRSLRCEHRNRLRYLLRKLVLRQNWVEASGVLGLLLKGTRKKTYLRTDRTKYWGRSDVLIEFLLFSLSQGATDKALDAAISLQQNSDFSRDPIANLVVALVFSHLWYNAIKKEVCLHDSLESGSLIQPGNQEIMLTGHSTEQSVVESQDSGPDSNTSIRIDKEDRKVIVEVDHEVKQVIPEYEMNSDDESDQNGNSLRFPHTGNKVYGSIVFAHDVEYLLMPITFPRTESLEDFISLQNRIQNDHYKAAVKHLQNALHSTPPAFQALLPLIQMLVFGDQVKEAIEEVESVVQNSHAALPFRLKASLLEHFSKEDANKLAICFEDTLRKDPTCSHSLAKLISLHHFGRGLSATTLCRDNK